VLEQLLHAMGFGLCHQLPERSFFAGGYQLPVCARDTGIYLGFALGLLALGLLARGTRPAELPRWPVLVLIGMFVAAMGVDGVTSYAGMRATTNDIRLITGMLTGWGLSALTLPMFNSQIWSRPGPVRVPSGMKQVFAWLGMLVIAFVAVRWLLPLSGVAYPVALTAAIFLTFGAINMVFVGLIPAFERRAARFRDAWRVVALAQVLTVAELAGAAWLRTLAEGLLG
jgi:uncharacterized membrane protein